MNVDWQISDTVRLRGRIVTPGVEIRVRGQRGRFAFVKSVYNVRTGARWIDAYEVDRHGRKHSLRSFRPEHVAVVHRTVRARQGRPAAARTAVAA